MITYNFDVIYCKKELKKPCIDPKRFNRRRNKLQPSTLNENSIGILWEISSSHPPFKDE